MTKTRITVAHGDGIGPEIMAATLKILEAAQAPLAFDTVEIGEKVYRAGHGSGIEDKTWQTLRENRVFLKAPITTPQGGGFKSLNVTIRKTLGLYANVRPCRAYHPFVRTKHPDMDLVIVRENEEDLYAGIEHRQTQEVYQCLKLMSAPGTEKIIRYAFEFAKQANKKKVSCFTKDNIMKMTDGLFHKTFDRIGAEYPEIEKDHWIIDIGTARLADTPEMFDVIVLPNLYGDILSDVAAQIAGSVGLGGSANIGQGFSMFEAIHGSAPDIAGKGIANPSGLILGAVQMLVHLGEGQVAEKIHNAWLKTLEEGIHTGDIFQVGISEKKVGTNEFTQELIARLGEKPSQLKPVYYPKTKPLNLQRDDGNCATQKRELVGVDIFLQEAKRDPDLLAQKFQSALSELPMKLQMITNRGVKVWPQGFAETFCTDHWRCRVLPKDEGLLSGDIIWKLLRDLESHNLDVIKTENLYLFDGEKGFSLGQGQ